jgi:hypothetical protein
MITSLTFIARSNADGENSIATSSGAFYTPRHPSQQSGQMMRSLH